MRGLQPLPLVLFRRALRAEHVTFAGLAKISGVGRSHLTQVLRFQRPGGRTWPKIREAVEALAPSALWALGELEQSATWNKGGVRSFLVMTEVGLAVHRSASAPALASDREVGAEHYAPTAVRFSCGAGVGAAN